MNTCAFIERAKLKHGNKFDYSKVNYINSKTKVLIICNTCNNIFEQFPYNHFNLNYKCYNCVYIINKKLRFNNFVEKAKLIHNNNKYDYSKVDYVFSYQKVIINCIIHVSSIKVQIAT